MNAVIRCGALLSLVAAVSGCAWVRKASCDDKTVSDFTTLQETTAAALESCDDFMAYQADKRTSDKLKYDMKSEYHMKAACHCLQEALAEGAAATLKEDCSAKINALSLNLQRYSNGAADLPRAD